MAAVDRGAGLPPLRTTVAGIIGGVAAYVIGYLATYVAVARDVERSLRPVDVILDLLAAEPIGTWRVVGWVFYSAHFVRTELVGGFGPVQVTRSVDIVGEVGGEMLLLYLVPVLVLVITGVVVAIVAPAREVSPGALAGASVVLGYALAVAVGLVAFSYANNGPDPVTGMALAGIVYPILLGAIGGIVGSIIRSRS